MDVFDIAGEDQNIQTSESIEILSTDPKNLAEMSETFELDRVTESHEAEIDNDKVFEENLSSKENGTQEGVLEIDLNDGTETTIGTESTAIFNDQSSIGKTAKYSRSKKKSKKNKDNGQRLLGALIRIYAAVFD